MQALPEGTRVRHMRLGLGEILESNADHTLIHFDIHGFMRFNTRFLNIAVVRWGPGTTGRQ